MPPLPIVGGMRILLALALVGLAPFAHAQVPPAASVTVVLPPWDDLLAPGGEARATPFEVRVACTAERVLPPTIVVLELDRRPAWAELTIEPSMFTRPDPTLCEGHEFVFRAQLHARATEQAPAFMPELVEVEASVSQSTGASFSAKASAPLTAAFFSILDVSAKRVPVAVAPGEAGTFDLVVTNFGNANTRVDVEIEALAQGLFVGGVEPFVLQSKQAGGTTIAKTLRIEIERASESTEPVPLVVRWRSRYALDPNLAGGAGEMRLMVLVSEAQESADDPAARVPMPTIPSVLALVFALALAMRRR